MKPHIYIILLFFLVKNLASNAQNKNITITFKRNADNSINFRYEKKLPGSFYLNIVFNNLQNCNKRTYKGVIKNNSGNLFKLKPVNKDKPINFSYKYSYTRGVPNPKTDSLFTYSLPFKNGKAITILESSNLNQTYLGSEKPSKWKSYIINRSVSDTVCSMRKGMVVKIVNEFNTDTTTQYSYKSNMNSILIEHTDGTFASYKGFKKNSFFVKLGQTVYPQTQLGVLDAFSKDTFRLYFNIYYLTTNILNTKKKTTVKGYKSNSEFLTPYFYTTNGTQQLKNRTHYIIGFNNNILFKEFTKREKKKYLKTPELFN